MSLISSIEGRAPNYYISAYVAEWTDQRARNIYSRAFDDEHYRKLIFQYAQLGSTDARTVLMNISELRRSRLMCLVDGALAACAPQPVIRTAVAMDGDVLTIGDTAYDLSLFDRVVVVGAGKASAAMAQALKEVLGDRFDSGLIVTKYGHGLAIDGCRVIESGHPVPDREGERAARELLALAGQVGARDLVLFLLSGGASALIPSPRPPVTLDDKMQATRLLLACGATIHEINAIRKHLSRLKGGLFAKALEPATVVTLIISDVVGDNLDVIGSGPTAPDCSTFDDCLEIIGRFGLSGRMPGTVMQVLRDGAAGLIPETTKHADCCFGQVRNHILANNEAALRGAAQAAERLGYRPVVLTSAMTGEAREVAAMLARTVRDHGRDKVCLLAGGETTVTIRGQGRGGRNQEMALALALELEREQARRPVSALCLGTDGSDGPTDAAGGLVLPETLRAARARDLHPEPYLANNDSYTFLKEADALLITGPTRTNVMDVAALIVGDE